MEITKLIELIESYDDSYCIINAGSSHIDVRLFAEYLIKEIDYYNKNKLRGI